MNEHAKHNALVEDVEAALNVLEKRGNALVTHFFDTHPRLNIAPGANFCSALGRSLRLLREEVAKHRVELPPEYDHLRENRIINELVSTPDDGRRYELAKALVAHLATKPK
jgi:hypothetical protein